MDNKSKKFASNMEINGASVLLLFQGDDAVIARNWQNRDKPDDHIDTREAR